MTRWKFQTRFGKAAGPAEERGNCMQAALASLLDIPLEDAPHILAQTNDGPGFWDELGRELHKRGWMALSLTPMHLPGFYIACGPSLNDVGHAVVMCDGKMVHEPNPTGSGLLSVDALILLAPLDPSKRDG